MGASFVQRLRAARPPAGTVVEALTPAETASSGPSTAPSLASSTVLPELRDHPQYEVLRELGRGGMGVVYLSRNKLMDRPEVLKVVNKQILDQPETAERFLREIRAAARLSHANIVTAYSAVQAGDLLAFAMEYVEGETLEQVVRTQGPLPVANACYYTLQVAQGLQHAFDKGLVHRDIKPQNLILAREGKKHVVKILDFGLAKATREGEAADRGLTGTGMMMGTPDYIAPEQTLDAARADIRADIYSLGCTLYYLLTGNPPFQAKSQFELLQAHHSKEATPLDQVRKDVPVELAAIVAKMMAKDPALRYQKPVEVAQALGPFAKPGIKPLPPAPVVPMKTVLENNATTAEVGKPMAAPTPAFEGTVIESDPTSVPATKEAVAKKKLPSRQRRGDEDKEAAREPAMSKVGLFIALAVGGVVVLGILGAVTVAIIFRSRGHDSSTANGGAQDAPLPGPYQLDSDYHHKFGSKLAFTVTGNADGFVYGTGIYTLDSTLAAAAVHAGVLRAGEAGIVHVEIIEPPMEFTGSTRNGVTSFSWGAFPRGAFRFILGSKDAPLPGPYSLGDYHHKFGLKLAFTVTGNADGFVWGTDLYTLDSTLAAAAVHAGVLRAGETGIVHLEIVDRSKETFQGSTRNGVTSRSWAAYPDGAYRFIKESKLP